MKDMNQVRIAVVTATIGHARLSRAVRSVQMQTLPGVEHWIIVDGPEFEASVRPTVAAMRSMGAEPSLTVLPYRTGMNGWCSHRIYAAAPFLVNADFVCFLDQDNWFEANHLETLLHEVMRRDSPAAYSLRNIYSQQGEFVCPDDCQSLGHLHDAFDRPGTKHIDTNCWLISRELAIEVAKSWCQPYTGDRVMAREMMARYPSLPCTGVYSVNYTAGSRAESASIEFFLDGNEVMRRHYPQGLPWRVRTRPAG